jgi:hypothetical protein
MLSIGQSVILSQSSDALKPNNVGITVELTDGAGNTEKRELDGLIFDTTPPTIGLTPPTPAFVAGAGSYNGVFTLTGGSVTDNLYPGDAGSHQYWGVWVANAVCSGTGACPVDTDPSLHWAAISTPTYTTFNWNLHDGLNSAVTTSGNEYYKTYIKFLDGAGNPSASSISYETTVAATAHSLYVPLIRVQR